MNGTMTLLPLYTFTVQTGTVMYLLYKFNVGSCHQAKINQLTEKTHYARMSVQEIQYILCYNPQHLF